MLPEPESSGNHDSVVQSESDTSALVPRHADPAELAPSKTAALAQRSKSWWLAKDEIHVATFLVFRDEQLARSDQLRQRRAENDREFAAVEQTLEVAPPPPTIATITTRVQAHLAEFGAFHTRDEADSYIASRTYLSGPEKHLYELGQRRETLITETWSLDDAIPAADARHEVMLVAQSKATLIAMCAARRADLDAVVRPVQENEQALATLGKTLDDLQADFCRRRDTNDPSLDAAATTRFRAEEARLLADHERLLALVEAGPEIIRQARVLWEAAEHALRDLFRAEQLARREAFPDSVPKRNCRVCKLPLLGWDAEFCPEHQPEPGVEYVSVLENYDFAPKGFRLEECYWCSTAFIDLANQHIGSYGELVDFCNVDCLLAGDDGDVDRYAHVDWRAIITIDGPLPRTPKEYRPWKVRLARLVYDRLPRRPRSNRVDVSGDILDISATPLAANVTESPVSPGTGHILALPAGTLEDAIVEVLAERGPMTEQALRSTLRVAPARLLAALHSLIDQERIEMSGRGVRGNPFVYKLAAR